MTQEQLDRLAREAIPDGTFGGARGRGTGPKPVSPKQAAANREALAAAVSTRRRAA